MGCDSPPIFPGPRAADCDLWGGEGGEPGLFPLLSPATPAPSLLPCVPSLLSLLLCLADFFYLILFSQCLFFKLFPFFFSKEKQC